MPASIEFKTSPYNIVVTPPAPADTTDQKAYSQTLAGYARQHNTGKPGGNTRRGQPAEKVYPAYLFEYISNQPDKFGLSVLTSQATAKVMQGISDGKLPLPARQHFYTEQGMARAMYLFLFDKDEDELAILNVRAFLFLQGIDTFWSVEPVEWNVEG